MTPLLFLVSSYVLAPQSLLAEKICNPAEPEKCAQGIAQGTPAPFTGQLMTNALAIDLGQKAEGCDKRIAIEVTKTTGELTIDLNLEQRKHAIDLEAWQQERGLMQHRIDQLSAPPPFYTRPWFVIPVTVIATLATVRLSVTIVDHVIR